MAEAIGVRRDGLGQRVLGWIGARDRASAAPPSAEATALIQEASGIFKALGHEGRLMILCHLVAGEKSVNELENILDARQSAVSQQLARLRMEGMVSARREGQMIYYSIKDPRILRLLSMLGTVLEDADTSAE